MFLFIHAEKVFHTHKRERDAVVRNEVLQSINKGCSICEFQATKDASLPELCFGPELQEKPREQYSSFHSSLYAGTEQISCGRGPPMML